MCECTYVRIYIYTSIYDVHMIMSVYERERGRSVCVCIFIYMQLYGGCKYVGRCDRDDGCRNYLTAGAESCCQAEVLPASTVLSS